MAGIMAPEYFKVSEFLGMEGNELAEDISRIASVIHISYEEKQIKRLSQVVAYMYIYFIAKGKLTDEYRQILDEYVNDLLILVDDFLKVIYGVDLKP